MRSKTKLITPLEGLINNYDWYLYNFNEYKNYKKNDFLTNLFFYYNIIYMFLYSLYAKNDINEAKHHCNSMAKSIEAYSHYFGGIADDGKVATIEHYFFNTLALLSDNICLVKKFQYYDYTMRNMFGNNEDENRQYFIEKRGFMFGYSMQCIINEDFEALNRCIEAAKVLHTKTQYKSRHYDVHIAVWEAIRDKNKTAIESSIQTLIKNSRTFNDNFWGDFMSIPATGYLKAAWIIGLEVEVKHKLIPMEMMPVKPLKAYKNDFKFFLPNNPEVSSLIGSLQSRFNRP